MKILIIGRYGQVGWELRRTLCTLGKVIALDQNELDLFKLQEIPGVVKSIHPDIIVNAAAYTDVERAEEDQENARIINSIAPGVLAEEAKKLNCALIHYSTDYVFNGKQKSSYSEEDIPDPINVYGRTKLDGENAIRSVDVPSIIIRTGWVYGSRGRNFLLKIFNLAKNRDILNIIDDQIGSPTWSRSIAEITAQILLKKNLSIDEKGEIINVTSSGMATWYEFTKEIFNTIENGRLKIKHIIPVKSEEFPTKAKRPNYTVLDNSYLNDKYNISIPDWRDVLRLVIEEIRIPV